MLVRDLIVKLRELNPKLEVWLAGDEEGNSFGPLGFVETSMVHPIDGDVVHPDDEGDYEPGQLEEAVVLWP